MTNNNHQFARATYGFRSVVQAGAAEWRCVMSTSSPLEQQWNARTFDQLARRISEQTSSGYLIENLLPERSLGVIAGGSGLGKSPFTYQMSLSIAAGVPFLGWPVRKSRVLYMDFENSLKQTQKIVSQLSKFLRLQTVPEELVLWNYNDAPATWRDGHLTALVAAAQPQLRSNSSLVT